MPTLHWIGKEKVINHHLDVPFKVLEHSYGYSDGNQNEDETRSGNKIIHGDNLEALKALLPEYEGRIKCIYIDPPYNTGNEGWAYNDNVNDPKIMKWLHSVVGKEGDDLSRHDKWLCMMYPRLKLLNKLLTKDGVLVMSIGYQEVFNIMVVCKELFANKQIVCITVQTSGGKPAGGFNYQHEYLIFIVPIDFEPNLLHYSGGIARSPYEGLTLATFNKTQRPNQVYPIFVNSNDGSLAGIGESLQERIKKGNYNGKLEDFQYNYNETLFGDDLSCNKIAIWPITSKGDECVWRLIPSRFLSDWNKGYIMISPNRSKDSLNKYSIQYLPSGVIKKIESKKLEVTGTEPGVPTLSFGENKTVGGEVPTIWIEKSFYTVKGTTLLNNIFGKKEFIYPKSLEFVSEILRAISSQNDIILDSFSGSATTAHAVLSLNKEDGGKRKFILVEMEEYAETITAERVKRVMNGYGDKDGTGGSFDYYELGEPLFLEDGNLNERVGTEKIRSYIWYSETHTSFSPLSEGLGEISFLGKNNDTAYYFYYKPDEVTTLDHAFLATMKTKAEQYIIYADNCLLTKAFMTRHHIIFKKIPRDIRRF